MKQTSSWQRQDSMSDRASTRPERCTSSNTTTAKPKPACNGGTCHSCKRHENQSQVCSISSAYVLARRGPGLHQQITDGHLGSIDHCNRACHHTHTIRPASERGDRMHRSQGLVTAFQRSRCAAQMRPPQARRRHRSTCMHGSHLAGKSHALGEHLQQAERQRWSA
jgi:hypothetical protein